MPCEILKIHMKPVNFFDKVSLPGTEHKCFFASRELEGISLAPRHEQITIIMNMKLILTVWLQNPALDVPPSEQSFNKSTLVSEQHHQPTAEAVVGQGGACCGPKL